MLSANSIKLKKITDQNILYIDHLSFVRSIIAERLFCLSALYAKLNYFTKLKERLTTGINYHSIIHCGAIIRVIFTSCKFYFCKFWVNVINHTCKHTDRNCRISAYNIKHRIFLKFIESIEQCVDYFIQICE